MGDEMLNIIHLAQRKGVRSTTAGDFNLVIIPAIALIFLDGSIGH